MNYKKIKEAALGGGCSKEDALWAVDNLTSEELTKITEKLRINRFGNKVSLCVIMNARCGCCPENCTFCSQSAHNKSEVTVFGFKNNDEIRENAKKAKEYSASNFGIVTSGVTVKDLDLEVVCEGIYAMTESTGFPNFCASFGRMSFEQLEQLKKAGLSRYHHNLETSQKFYPEVCTTHDWQERVDTVKNALAAGLNVCSGGLFGLGESWDDRADLALVLKDLGVDSVPLNFLHAHDGTPLESQAPLLAEEALRIIALYRLMLPEVTLRICGGRPKILGDRMREMFRYGANAFMTGDYLTTSGITPQSDIDMIKAEGLIVEEQR